MALSKAQLNAIVEIIERRFLVFTYEALGKRALTPTEITQLTRLGLLRRGTRHMISDPHTLGKIAALVDRARARRLGYDDIMRIAKQMLPPTEIEKRAIEYATDHAGQHMRRLRDTMVRTVGLTTSGAALREVRSRVAESIARRTTVSQLKSDLWHSFTDIYRDWTRVANTEITDAIQNAIFQEIADNSEDGLDQLVYKRPNPDACPHCRRLYLQRDGITPRIFKLRQLAPNNVGRKAADWLATVGPIHPWCQCQLIPVTKGYEFKTTRIVVKPFEQGGVKYKKGQVVEGITGLPEENIGLDAVLTFTGKDAKATKSLSHSEKACTCRGVNHGSHA